MWWLKMLLKAPKSKPPQGFACREAALLCRGVLGLFLLACCLASCGFHPVYGSKDEAAPVAEQLNQVAIDSIPERMGQMLRNELIDRMYKNGRPSAPRYRLVIALRVTQEDLGIHADATSSRSLLNMYADYSLRDLNDKEILRGTGHSISSYNKLNDQYGNLASMSAAVQRTLNEVGKSGQPSKPLFLGSSALVPVRTPA